MLNLRLAIVVGAAAASIGVGALAPAPAGHEQMLRDLIGDAAQGHLRYETLTPNLAAAVKSQAAVAQSQLTALGALKSISFEEINSEGSEIYRTVFEHGALDWAFAVDEHGLISNAAYRPVATTK